MALKKSQLYSSLWQSCDELRGGMDASQYKDYVLAVLFIKYVSDRYAGVPYSPITVPDGSSFDDMVIMADQQIATLKAQGLFKDQPEPTPAGGVDAGDDTNLKGPQIQARINNIKSQIGV